MVNNFGDTRSGGLAGPMGLFVILLMAIATVLLIRNMNKRLRRLPDSFEPRTRGDQATTSDDQAAGAGRADAAADDRAATTDRPPSSSGDADSQVSDARRGKGRTEADG